MPRRLVLLAFVAWAATYSMSAPAQTAPPAGGSDQPATESLTSPSVTTTVGHELGRWGRDGVDLTLRPLHWERQDWKRFAVFSAILAGLLLTDESVMKTVQDHTNSTTDEVRRDTEWLGAWGAVGISAGLLVGGLASGNENVRDMGRDAIEASVITVVFVGALKTVAGRERPRDSNGESVFKPFSGGASFPSSHAAEAFAVASVIATRSEGWAIPTVCYGLASLVAVDRVIANAHFPSDVFAGAALGTAVGHYLVVRHQREAGNVPGPSPVQFALLPMRGGLGAIVAFSIGRS